MRGLRLHEARRARELRQGQTEAERELWRRLRNRLLGGFKFVRQEPMGPVSPTSFAERKNSWWRSTARHIQPMMSAARTRRANSSCTIEATGWLASAMTKSTETSRGFSIQSLRRWSDGRRCRRLAANLPGPSPQPSPRFHGERELAGRTRQFPSARLDRVRGKVREFPSPRPRGERVRVRGGAICPTQRAALRPAVARQPWPCSWPKTRQPEAR
jgi:hypothetical protein